MNSKPPENRPKAVLYSDKLYHLNIVKSPGLTPTQQERLSTHIEHVIWAALMKGKDFSEIQVMNLLLAELKIKSIDTLEQLSQAQLCAMSLYENTLFDHSIR
jgi:uncharacterized membrane protein YheB (UPF0754 family)